MLKHAMDVKVNVRPIFSNVVHTAAVWEGPCRVGRPEILSPEYESRAGKEEFKNWKKTVVRIVADKGAQGGKLYGSITGKEIAEQLVAMGYNVDKKQIVLKDPIRAVGTYNVNVKMYAEIAVQITVVVE